LKGSLPCETVPGVTASPGSAWVVLARVFAAVTGAWAGVFAILHVYWAFGGRAFLGESPAADAAFARPSFAIYNASVAVLCVVGLAVAAVLFVAASDAVPRPGGPRRLTGLAVVAAWVACVLLVLRGGGGLVQGLLGLAPPASQQASYNFDAWFLLGGGLFGFAAATVTIRGHRETRGAAVGGPSC